MTPMNPEQNLAMEMVKDGMPANVLSGSYLTLAGLVLEMDKSPITFNPQNSLNVFLNNGFLPVTRKTNGQSISVFACCAYHTNDYLNPETCGEIREACHIGVKFEDCLRTINIAAISKETAYFVILNFEQYAELMKNKVWEKVQRKNYLNNIDQDSAAVECVAAILAGAVSLGASDIHIKPDPNFSPKPKDTVRGVLHYQDNEAEAGIKADDNIGGSVQYRLLGVLHHAHTLTGMQIRKVVAKIKTMSNLKMDEHRVPQDGRLNLSEEMIKQAPYYKNYDLRVSVLPTIHGEKVVMRLLRRQLQGYRIEDLGFPNNEMTRIVKSLSNPKGLLLVIGPTGSGKTTTLYTLLSLLNNGEKNILTAEDPVEIQLPGITQVSINEKVGLNFAACAKAFMRQDPDVIFIGEIRDSETAIMAAQAASTGHLVFSTLHADSALGVPGRFGNLGVDVRMILPLLLGVVAQRLTRRLCRYCLEQYDGLAELSNYFELKGLSRRINLSRRGAPRSCVQCSGTGYDKRVLVSEIWFPDQLERDIICRGDNEYLKMLQRAKANGFKPMTEAAISLVLDSETSLEEMMRSAVTEEELLRDRKELGQYILDQINSV